MKDKTEMSELVERLRGLAEKADISSEHDWKFRHDSAGGHFVFRKDVKAFIEAASPANILKLLSSLPPSGAASEATVELLEIPEKGGLDAINVYWHNVGPGKGYVTITCWGSAWTSWFGGMGDRTIQQFFANSDVSYFVSKLGITQHLKSKRNEAYLARIITAIKEALHED